MKKKNQDDYLVFYEKFMNGECSTKEVESHLGVNYVTFLRWMKENKLPLKRKHSNEYNFMEVYKSYLNGETNQKNCNEKWGINYVQFIHEIKIYNLPHHRSVEKTKNPIKTLDFEEFIVKMGLYSSNINQTDLWHLYENYLDLINKVVSSNETYL